VATCGDGRTGTSDGFCGDGLQKVEKWKKRVRHRLRETRQQLLAGRDRCALPRTQCVPSAAPFAHLGDQSSNLESSVPFLPALLRSTSSFLDRSTLLLGPDLPADPPTLDADGYCLGTWCPEHYRHPLYRIPWRRLLRIASCFAQRYWQVLLGPWLHPSGRPSTKS
jgi:hypothetical protein